MIHFPNRQDFVNNLIPSAAITVDKYNIDLIKSTDETITLSFVDGVSVIELEFMVSYSLSRMVPK